MLILVMLLVLIWLVRFSIRVWKELSWLVWLCSDFLNMLNMWLKWWNWMKCEWIVK